MKKMSIKRKRTLQHFINAAKEIIEKEGVDQVTARKVGKLSGYSYATIYNYFVTIQSTHLIQYKFDHIYNLFQKILP